MFGSFNLPTLVSLPPPPHESKERKLKIASDLRQEQMSQNLAISDSLMQIPLELECGTPGSGAVWRGTFEEKFPAAKLYPSLSRADFEWNEKYLGQFPSSKPKPELKVDDDKQYELVYSSARKQFLLLPKESKTFDPDVGCRVVNDPKLVCEMLGATGTCAGVYYPAPRQYTIINHAENRRLHPHDSRYSYLSLPPLFPSDGYSRVYLQARQIHPTRPIGNGSGGSSNVNKNSEMDNLLREMLRNDEGLSRLPTALVDLISSHNSVCDRLTKQGAQCATTVENVNCSESCKEENCDGWISSIIANLPKKTAQIELSTDEPIESLESFGQLVQRKVVLYNIVATRTNLLDYATDNSSSISGNASSSSSNSSNSNSAYTGPAQIRFSSLAGGINNRWHEMQTEAKTSDESLRLLSGRTVPVGPAIEMSDFNAVALNSPYGSISDAELTRTICEFFKSGNRLDTSIELIVQMVTIADEEREITLTPNIKFRPYYYFLKDDQTMLTDFFPNANEWLQSVPTYKLAADLKKYLPPGYPVGQLFSVLILSNIQRIELTPWRKN